MTTIYQTNRTSERGNALFLILIAVVLFAALSYAITQSNRSSGNASNETNLIASSTVTQYPAAIRTGITRMMLRGAGVSDLLFNPPSAYVGTTYEVFHPSGGGVVYQNVDPNTVESVIPTGTNATQNWYFPKAKVVTDIGTTTGDVVAILTRVKTGICNQINQQLTGSTTIPASGMTEANLVASPGTALSGAGIDGQPFLCVSTTDQGNAYYHVLVEQ
jgi:hypothetical protein